MRASESSVIPGYVDNTTAAAAAGCWADVAREVRGHLARLDELLDGDADRYSGEELRRLRASLQQILSDAADGANVNVDSLRGCLTDMMQLMGGPSDEVKGLLKETCDDKERLSQLR